MLKWDGSNWTDLGAVSTASNLLTGTVTSFSDFTAGEPLALPVEWLSFTAETKENSVFLDWITLQEIHADLFIIERTTDLQLWTELGNIKAAGNTSDEKRYQYQDKKPTEGLSWYRIRQVDVDGSYQYSPTIQVLFGTFSVSLYPNPVRDIISLEFPEQRMLNVQMIDIHGRTVLETSVTGGKVRLNVQHLPASTYILKLGDSKGWEKSFHVVKE